MQKQQSKEVMGEGVLKCAVEDKLLKLMNAPWEQH